MVIKNKSAAYIKIPELRITIGPGRTVDLDGVCSSDQQRSSRELKRSIEKGWFQVVTLDASRKASFVAQPSFASSSVEPKNLRRVVFVQE